LTKLLQSGAYFIAWLLLSLPGIWFFIVVQKSLFQISVIMKLNPWAVRAVEQWGVFLFGIIWIVVIFTLEGYLRTALAKNRLWQRVQRVVLLELLFAAMLLLVQWSINFIA